MKRVGIKRKGKRRRRTRFLTWFYTDSIVKAPEDNPQAILGDEERS